MASLLTSSLAMLEPRGGLWGQAPPEPRTRASNNPTLLFSWWCTIFSAVIIITRLCGRKTRSNVLFKEDWIMMAALVPLLIRMAFIHVVLIYGTNNVETVGMHYTDLELEHRSTGARLVLAARIFYAMFIWLSKLTISEFLKRITIRIWRKSYEWTLQGIRIFLVITFFVVVVSTLCECQPFDHYWQVVPDPGPHCRQGYGNLIAMGTCDVITDLLLIAFPIPIILRSGQTWKRKFQLVSLFSLSIILIIVTLLRVPRVIEESGRQQYRTVWASCEILASTAVSNTVIIGSFLRDKGTKKNKYRSSSITDSIDRASARRPTITAIQNTGSDEDLFRFLGMRVPDHLQDKSTAGPRPAPAAEPASRHPSRSDPPPPRDWDARERGDINSSDSDDSLRKPPVVPSSQPPSLAPSSTPVSLFDVGGLLGSSRTHRTTRGISPHTQHNGPANGVLTHDFAPSTPSESRRTSRVHDAPSSSSPTSRRNSRTFVPPPPSTTSTSGPPLQLHDFGGLLTPTTSRASSGMDRYFGRRQSDSHLHPPPGRQARPPPPTGVLGPMLERHETQYSLQDAGGLLGTVPEASAGGRAGRAGSVSGRGGMPLERIMSDSAAEGVASHRPPVRQAREDDIELADLGGVLGPGHQEDVSVASLRRAQWRGYAEPPRPVPAPATQSSGGGWEGMDIHDPGGLLGRAI